MSSAFGQLTRLSREDPRSPLPKLILDNVHMLNNDLGLPPLLADLFLLRLRDLLLRSRLFFALSL
jgi:hypothetical protein